mgnify:CR=1 FL=1
MARQKKRRLRVGRLLFLLLIIAVISFACIKYIKIPIMSILITGNENLTDQEVIEKAELDDYKSYFSVIPFIVEKKLNKDPYIKEAKVSKGILNIKIKIKENNILYIDKKTNEKVTIDGKIIDKKIVCAPYLINGIPSERVSSFKKGLTKIEKDVLCQMSEIKYDPNEIDLDRYYVYMNDGNGVYLTVNKFSKINKYNKILENIGKQNGILYLDYGDYFMAK